MSNIAEIFDAAVKEGLDKDGIIMRLVSEGGLSVTVAVREYMQMAKNAGLVMGVAERSQQVAEMLAEYNNEDLQNVETRRDLIVEIADKFDISEASAAAHIRKYCEDQGIELPSVKRTSLEDMIKFVQELVEAEKSGKEIKAALEEEMGYTANSAASAYSRAMRELGLSSGRVSTTVPLSETVALLRANHTLGRKALIRKLADDLGYAESTAGAFVTYINFAKEWAKQELAAQ